MVQHLYFNFLDNPSEYRNAEEYWERLCREVIDLHSSAADWAPWLNTHFPDGRLIEPGNPIYNVKSASLNRALRIIQVAGTSDVISISAWVNKINDECLGVIDLEELVINCELSNEAAIEARKLIVDWLNAAK
jgi:hypothetical protein